jgi:hypothetical protein
MFEEGNDGHTQAIELLKPVSKVKNVEMRHFVLNDLYRSRGLSLTEAAVELAVWLDENDVAPKGMNDIGTELRAACAPYERKVREVTDDSEMIERSYIRLARYYFQMYAEDAGQHTRVPDYFIPIASIPRGKSHTGTSHPEHVVPCAVIRDYCLAYFEQNRSLDEVVKLIRRLLVIVDISEEERKILDTGRSALKDKMPEGWDLEKDCIFARLHSAKIKFDVPLGCSCAH